MPSPRCIALVLLSLCAFVAARGASPESDWPDGKGGTFRGEPVEALGPLLVFRTGPGAGRSLPARLLPPADCVRFFQAVASRPARAARWSEGRGAATTELVGRIERVEGGKVQTV